MSFVTFPNPAGEDWTEGEVSEQGNEGALSAGRERSAAAARRILALGEMTAGIIHDFRNILGVIASSLRVAQDNADDATKRNACLTAAEQAIARGLAMTSSLLTFPSRNKSEIGPEDLNKLVRGLEALLKYGAGSGIKTVFNLAPDLPVCVVEPAQFSSAILNLVINSRQAMPEGGVIEIETGLVFGAPGGLGGGHEVFVSVSVSDSGQGMPPSVTRRIFDPYFTTKGDAGTGLGLPQVCAFAKAMGGFVRVESQEGAGTTVGLFFPVRLVDAQLSPKLWQQLDHWTNEGGATEEESSAGAELAPSAKRMEAAPGCH
jgi:signal transduction histidine kinase